MRQRKKKWAPGQLANNPRIIRDVAGYAGQIGKYFGNDNPIHIEIGCGKGRFIAESSRLNPDVNFIAIEREDVILAAAARHSEESGACSLGFLLMDADMLLEIFRPGDISRLYLNFSDPWPGKKKRAKRRLTHEKYLVMYEQLAIPEMHFKTDNRMLFEYSIESLSSRQWQIKNVSLDLHKSGMEGNIMTEYEKKFSSMGMPIYRLEASPPKGAVALSTNHA
ncbi:MAG: tRNA (guanosine(46)-N7)-methyltransferase TrmB [Defluviitaleaceae bacterium]|nr:tRNA (guanosine(46)-N7)-methyltransferase TrmB [Defluviitaleaceae bacterium]